MAPFYFFLNLPYFISIPTIFISILFIFVGVQIPASNSTTNQPELISMENIENEIKKSREAASVKDSQLLDQLNSMKFSTQAIYDLD